MRLLDFHTLDPLSIDPPGEPVEARGVNVVVETPQGSRNKFNWDEELGVFRFSRTLRAGMVWPCEFGFVPQTVAGDGDPLDVAVLMDAPTFPGCLVRVRLLGIIGLVKNGERNDRLLACPARSKKAPSAWDEVQDLEHLLPRQIREVEAFLSDYNTFEGHEIELTGWGGAEEAMAAVHEAVQAWKEGHA